jgi:hypothetical protein
MNSGEDERLRGDGDDAIALGVRTYLCTKPLPCTYLPDLDGKSSDARGALELLPSGLGLVRSLARSFTDAQAASLATSNKHMRCCCWCSSSKRKINKWAFSLSTITNTPLSRKRVSRTQRRSLWEE